MKKTRFKTNSKNVVETCTCINVSMMKKVEDVVCKTEPQNGNIFKVQYKITAGIRMNFARFRLSSH